MEIIKGGVTAAKGFTASGMHVGLRRNINSCFVFPFKSFTTLL